MCHSMSLFELCNRANALSGLTNLLSQGPDIAKLWALGPHTHVIGSVSAPQQVKSWLSTLPFDFNMNFV